MSNILNWDPENLYYALREDLGEDVIGLYLINLAKLRLEGRIGEDNKELVKEALAELFNQAGITNIPGHPFR